MSSSSVITDRFKTPIKSNGGIKINIKADYLDKLNDNLNKSDGEINTKN